MRHIEILSKFFCLLSTFNRILRMHFDFHNIMQRIIIYFVEVLVSTQGINDFTCDENSKFFFTSCICIVLFFFFQRNNKGRKRHIATVWIAFQIIRRKYLTIQETRGIRTRAGRNSGNRQTSALGDLYEKKINRLKS